MEWDNKYNHNIHSETVYPDLLGKFFIVMTTLFASWLREHSALDFIVGSPSFHRIATGSSGPASVSRKLSRSSFTEKALLNFSMSCWTNNLWDTFCSLNFSGNKLWRFTIARLSTLLSCNKYQEKNFIKSTLEFKKTLLQ